MDSGQDNIGSEIPQVGRCLETLFKKTLCPMYVKDKDMVRQISPWENADYRVGIYLYDIQDYSVMATQAVMTDDKERRFPPKAVELSYMIFCNESSKFGGIQREQIQIVLNETVRTVYDYPILIGEYGEEIQISFAREDMDFKIRLWQSFSRPLQPAVYIRAVPVLISSGRTQNISRVEERDYRVEKKE